MAAAEARKKAVREKVLSLIGGLPDYRGPLRPRVTRTTPREGAGDVMTGRGVDQILPHPGGPRLR